METVFDPVSCFVKEVGKNIRSYLFYFQDKSIVQLEFPYRLKALLSSTLSF